MSSAAWVRRVPRRPFCFGFFLIIVYAPFAMTSETTISIHPLGDRQERRLLDYLDEKYLEIHQQYSERSVSRDVACTLLSLG